MKPEVSNAREENERKNLGETLFLSNGCNGIHMYRRRRGKKDIWECFGCSHYLRKLEGRKGICWECGEVFIIGKARKGGREIKVRCSHCGGSGIKLEKSGETSKLAAAILYGLEVEE